MLKTVLSVKKDLKLHLYTFFLELPLCRGYYYSCMDSMLCQSGIVCVQSSTASQCCTSPHTECPNINVIGIRCNKRSPVNW